MDRLSPLPTAPLDNLQLRAELLRRLRSFFFDRGFLEVETPILSADTVVDRHLDPFGVEITSVSLPSPLSPLPQIHYLQTSPEFGMKRLLAAGAKAIYQVSKVFRRDEVGPLHNPEFTMVEWYRAGDGMSEGMQLTSDLCEALLARGPAERIGYREAFSKHVGIDPLAAETKTIIETVRRLDIAYPESLPEKDRDGWLDLLLVEKIQPHLGKERPTIVYDFPAGQAALSVIRPENPPVAERFELYVEGIELANGYHELLDVEELRRRNKTANAQRMADGKPPLPEESRLLEAMQAGLPPCTGVALGFDRLVMLAAGAKTLAEVLAFPFDRA
ncbi:MAG: EF-P lysine aminoacylase GenX [Pirellulales bacterium]|nr:EF-P lysine aminoacylase GenX [Pirellulales bacterium]